MQLNHIPTRICSECKRTFPITDYHKSKTGKHNTHAQCPECRSKKYKKYYAKAKVAIRKQQKKSYKKNRPDRLLKKKEQYQIKKELERADARRNAVKNFFNEEI